MSGEGCIRILSDVHLGHAATQVREVGMLEPLLEGAREVVFNGDTCEQTMAAWIGRGEEQLGELKELCRKAGVVAHLVAGNHDPHVSEVGWMEFGEGRVFVTHGDLILRDVAPWSREYLRSRLKVRRILEEAVEPILALEDLRRRARRVEAAMVPELDRWLERNGGRYRWTALWPPRRMLNMLTAWMTMFAEAERFAERWRPGCGVFVFGHFHRSGVRESGGRVVCNTGAFMRGLTPLMVELEGDWLRVVEVDRDKAGLFQRGEIRAVFRLGAQLSRSM